MNIKTIFSLFSLLIITLIAVNSYGQDPVNMQNKEKARGDSLQKMNDYLNKNQETRDAYRMDNAKEAKKVSKAKSKRVQQIENDADNASDQSKKALRAEKKAQSSRKKANQQARKASDARDKSDRN